MTEWGVIGVIVTLGGFAIAIITPIVKLTRAIAELTTTMRMMDRQVAELTTSNKDSHKRLWEHNSEQDEAINDHEVRIGILEHTKAERKE